VARQDVEAAGARIAPELARDALRDQLLIGMELGVMAARHRARPWPVSRARS
jgi:hypothetical protein